MHKLPSFTDRRYIYLNKDKLEINLKQILNCHVKYDYKKHAIITQRNIKNTTQQSICHSYIQSLKTMSREIIKQNICIKHIDKVVTKPIIKKCHEALHSHFNNIDNALPSSNDIINHIHIINNYINLTNQIKLPKLENKNNIIKKPNCFDFNKIKNNDSICYQNLKQAFLHVYSNLKNLSYYYKGIISTLKIDKDQKFTLLINLHKGKNLLYLNSILKSIVYKIYQIKNLEAENDNIICYIKCPINNTAILYYKAILEINLLINFLLKYINDHQKKDYLNIIKDDINSDSKKIIDIFNLPELSICFMKNNKITACFDLDNTKNIENNVINLISQVEIAKEFITNRKMKVYDEKGILQDNLIMIDYFNTYSDKLFNFLINHYNIDNIKNVITNYVIKNNICISE